MSRFPWMGGSLLLLIVFGAATNPAADPAPQQSLTPEQLEILANANPEQSADVARKCARCHGKTGISDDRDVPHLAGQNPRYVFKQLWDYKNLYRDGGRIKKIAKRLSAQDIANLTARFSSSELPAMEGVESPTPPALVMSGDAGRDIDACVDCHGNKQQTADGDYELPSLAGMPYDYFVETMLAFKDGLRYNDPNEVMAGIANAVTEQEINDLADYYLALGQRRRMPEE